jgi:hypothetical protein
MWRPKAFRNSWMSSSGLKRNKSTDACSSGSGNGRAAKRTPAFRGTASSRTLFIQKRAVQSVPRPKKTSRNLHIISPFRRILFSNARNPPIRRGIRYFPGSKCQLCPRSIPYPTPLPPHWLLATPCLTYPTPGLPLLLPFGYSLLPASLPPGASRKPTPKNGNPGAGSRKGTKSTKNELWNCEADFSQPNQQLTTENSTVSQFL